MKNLTYAAKALLATAIAAVGGLVQATMDSSAGGNHILANEGWTVLGTALAALAVVYATPNSPRV